MVIAMGAVSARPQTRSFLDAVGADDLLNHLRATLPDDASVGCARSL
jgi:hypothetical protein